MSFKERKADITDFYKTANGVRLPLEIFLPDKGKGNGRTVLLIHGGGFTDAVKDNSVWGGGWLSDNAKYLAEKGFLSIVISYRSLELSKELTVPDQLKDCADAVAYIRKSYAFVGFEDITYLGESAGGYFAVMLGLSQEDALRPKRVIAVNPVLNNLGTKWKYGFSGIDDTDGLTPINCIGEKAADFLFLHGTRDEVVDIGDTEELHEALLKSGKRSEFFKIPGKNHAFLLYGYIETDVFITGIMDRIIKFINKE